MKKIVISYGPTRVYIDEIMYLTYKSSKKTGQTLIKHLKPDYNVIAIDADQDFDLFQKQLFNELKDADVYISAAAITDFVVDKVNHKIKKEEINSIPLKPAPDLLMKLKDNPNLIKIGFKLDADINNARQKLKTANLDAIIYNPVSAMGSNNSPYVFINHQEEIKITNDTKEKNLKVIAGLIKKMI